MKQEVDSKDRVDAYRNERFVIFKEENEGDRQVVTTDEERVLRYSHIQCVSNQKAQTHSHSLRWTHQAISRSIKHVRMTSA